MCAVQVPLRRDVSTTDNLDVLVTVGGRSETSMIRGSTTEIWWCALLRPQPRWFRSSCSSSILPSRTFHTLTTINLSLAVLTGGIDDNNQPRDECFSISWSTDATTGDKASFLNLVPVVEPISALPCPLAFHACVCLKDSSLLVLGTSYAIGENSPSCSRVLRLVDVGSQWEDVVLKPPLPSMYNTTAKVATVSGVECVFVLGELRMTHRALKLFKIVLTESTSGFLTEIPFSNEFAPQCTYGVSMHISDDFLYVIGGRVCCPIDKDYSFNLLLNEPVRALIGIDEDNTGSDKEE
ncbi:unnamed protein product [Trypanosoma congolense IL3000]|nr:unnamed protein product [Trypanosoma congolense IL3000]